MTRLVRTATAAIVALSAATLVAQAQDASDLEGTSWTLSTLAGEPAAEGVETTLAFQADNQVGGRGGCNSFGGTLSFDGESQIVATQMACEEPAMGQEIAFFAALNEAASYELDGDTLTLLGAEGEELASLSSAG